MVFITKELLEGEVDNICRGPADIRPISLGNTDGKIVSAALNVPLAAICSETCSQTQHGFVRGRLLTDCVWSLEQASALFALQASTFELPARI